VTPVGSRVINLRSDTQTLPTPAMRVAMARAELGDDTYREDPTVRELEALVAERLGMEAALLLLSGTMANLVALLTHCRRSDEIFLDARAHLLLNEAGGLGGVAGVVPTVVASNRGHVLPDALEGAIRSERVQQPRPRLVWIENTHNRAGGTVLDGAGVAAIVAVAQRQRLLVHVDGARLFNAARALRVEPPTLLDGVDSVYVDLTKGLACPLGALLAGSTTFVEEARRNRQLVGGGMRQAGVIAACGLVALRELVERLDDDHARARRLAERLAEIEGIELDVADVETNLVFVGVGQLAAPETVAAALAEEGVLVSTAPGEIRLVTHLGIDDEAAAFAADACARVAQRLRRPSSAGVAA